MAHETNEQFLEIITNLDKRLKNIENDRVPIHQHSGLDAPQIRFKDLSRIFYKEVTFNPASLLDGQGTTLSEEVIGAQLGDFALVSAPYDLEDITVTAYVQAEDTVEVRVQNESGSTVDLASDTWRIIVIKKLV